MSQKRNTKWSQQEEAKLISLYYSDSSYDEMSKELGRSWYACKCRLMKLKLIPVDKSEPSSIEKYTVPHPKEITFEAPDLSRFGERPMGYVEDEDTSHTFSDKELNIVLDYFKARLAKLAIQKLDTSCFRESMDINQCEDFMKTEMSKIKQFVKMNAKQKEKYLIRIN